MRSATAFRLTGYRTKGHLQPVEAMRASRHPDVRLIVCGSGNLPGLVSERSFWVYDLLMDPARLAWEGGRTARWIRQAFAPEGYVPLAARRPL